MDGCVVVDSVLIPDAVPVVDSMTVGPIVCASDPMATSFVDLHLSDSTNTTVSWSHGETTTYIDSLNAGMYYVNLNDTLRGCFATDSVMMSAPDTLLLSMNSVNVGCYGDSTGSLTANVTGGETTYQYSWSNGEITSGISGLPVGWYTVTVTDSLGCIVMDSMEITQPAASISSIGSYWNDSTGNCVGGATVVMQGGTSPYSYQWNDPSSTTTETVSGLCAGTYEVMVTDANGCTSLIDVTILNTLSIAELNSAGISLYPNPANDILHIDLSSEQLLGTTYVVLDNKGRLISEGNLNALANMISLVDLATGVYFIELEGMSEVFQLVKQ